MKIQDPITAVLVGAFEEKCPTLTVGSFFRRVRSTFLFICWTTWMFKTYSNSKRQSHVQSKKKRNKRPELRQHTKDPPLAFLVFLTFFRHYETFLKIFWVHQRVPLLFYDILQQWMSINPKEFPLLHFSAMRLFEILIFWFFSKVF